MRWSRATPSVIGVACAIFLIRIYRYLISPVFAGSCRFEPTCSAYAMEALQRHGLLKGLLFSISRILRCNCFSRGGYDPVPAVKKMRT